METRNTVRSCRSQSTIFPKWLPTTLPSSWMRARAIADISTIIGRITKIPSHFLPPMPLYEFRCETCGPFEQWRTLAEAGTPMLCPTCDAIAKRVFSPPNVSLNSGSLGQVGGESKEPRLVKRSQDQEPATSTYSQQQNGRPWMISH